MSNKNPCARKVDPANAYECWQSANGAFTYWVLKKYKSPEQEASDPFARWYIAVQSPAINKDSFEFGDMLALDVKRNMKRVDNPLCSYLCLRLETTFLPSTITRYRYVSLRGFHSRLVNYIRLQVPKKDMNKVQRILNDHNIHIVCQDV